MIFHALDALRRCSRIEQVLVVLSPGDEWWASFDWAPLGEKLSPVFCGGATRAESVANGLSVLAEELEENDWVLVHDAARPCLSQSALDQLIDTLADDPVGGILAMPVADTLKRSNLEQRIVATEPRDGLWQAQTPQMFRYGLLRHALTEALTVTDEASAVEAQGHSPVLVRSDLTNLKVTFPADLGLAEMILQGREE